MAPPNASLEIKDIRDLGMRQREAGEALGTSTEGARASSMNKHHQSSCLANQFPSYINRSSFHLWVLTYLLKGYVAPTIGMEKKTESILIPMHAPLDPSQRRPAKGFFARAMTSSKAASDLG